jgi:hypothetical protein
VPREGLAHAERERGLQGMPREGTAGQPLRADIDGFSLHAAVRVEAHDRKRLEQLCRCITRPALSDDWVQLNAAGQVQPKPKTPWSDGPEGRARPVAGPFARHKQSTGGLVSGPSTTHLVMSPLEFMQRPLEWLPCGGLLHWFDVSRGSAAADRGRRPSGRSTWGSAFRR